MNTTTAAVVALGILAVVFATFFLVFRKSGKGKIEGPFGTSLDVEGSNEAKPTRVTDANAGKNLRVTETGGRGVDASKLSAGEDLEITSSSDGGGSRPKK